MSKMLLLQGNQAVAEGAIAAGVRFFGGYPITPSTEVAEQLAKALPQVGGKFIQMEDEIAGIGAIIGALGVLFGASGKNGRAKAGLVLNGIVIAVALVRMSLGGGIV